MEGRAGNLLKMLLDWGARLQGAHLLQAGCNEAAKRLAEVVRQVRWRLLRDQEQDPHGMQVCMRGLPHCHLQQKG